MILPEYVLIIPLASVFISHLLSIFTKKGVKYFISFALLITALVALDVFLSVLDSKSKVIIISGYKPPFGINLFVSVLSSFLVLLITVTAFLISLYNLNNMEEKRTYFHTLFILFVFASQAMILSGDIFNVFVFMEIAAISAFALSATGNKGAGTKGAIKYLIMAGMGSMIMLLGIGSLYSAIGSLNIAHIGANFKSLNAVFASFVLITILTGILVESKIFPFNFWVPETYNGAPSGISASLSGVIGVAGLYILARVLFTFAGNRGGFYGAINVKYALAILAVITVFIGETTALFQTKVKKILAFSSVAQAGMIVFAMTIATETGLISAMFLILSHTLAKTLLFLIAGYIIKNTGKTTYDEMQGVFSRQKYLGVFFAVGALSLMGIPFFAGFWGKIGLVKSGISAGGFFYTAIFVVLVASIVEGAYFMRLTHKLFSEKHDDKQGKIKIKITFIIPVIILVALILFAGLFPGYFAEIFKKSAQEIINPEAHYINKILSTGLMR